MPRLSKPNAHVLPHIAKFHTVNGLSSDDHLPVELVDHIVQCFSIAFSLRIILTNFPSWKLVDHQHAPFNKHTDFASVAKHCLAHISKQSKPKKVEAPPKVEKVSTPSKTASPKPKTPKSHLFELDTSPRKGAAPKRRADEVTPSKKDTKPSEGSSAKKMKVSTR